MRKSTKQDTMNQRESALFGMDFHQFIEKEPSMTNYELAEEFGVNLEAVKKLKRQINR
ncbi:RNA polymerase subunit sigma-70 [Pseudalkalibacillus berkeleyi]|uniref:RNA polymerase subunit sigma-70 n=1 Tax=Pseudalkalibacillus berkeleyi TaxID=1069813 RepID=A0ABS9GZ74_9BACL|nr:RNA polymerase subunit sigma-70 [Pseudalkalibacillus berkeleyi]MCF6138057.1 RNA polymerase subunit sigma-70 [Pseudalkalibacillus berkeleyi]